MSTTCRPATADDLAYCASVTRSGGSNLWFVSKLLPSEKKPLFTASYASMRYIDDLVDDEFLELPDQARQDLRADYLDRIEEWELKSIGRRTLGSQPEDAIYRALAQTIHQTDLGSRPWSTLADAMRRDVNETPLQDWGEFDEYSNGATVSPAVVYLYILLCRREEGGTFTGPRADWLYDAGRDMAIFCYLVHIMRDLAKDAAGCAQLLTVPQLLKEQLRDGKLSGSELIQEVAAKAEHHKRQMSPYVEELSNRMAWREGKAFSALLGIYIKLFKKIRQNPDRVFHEDPQDLDEVCRQEDE